MEGHQRVSSLTETATTWPDEVDEILAGDLTAAFIHTTPAGGAVAVPVAPLGLRDRTAGTVSFTTSRSFGRKLQHIARDRRVALCYHSRQHGLARGSQFVVVQGDARVIDDQAQRPQLEAAAAAFGLMPLEGRFWDWWLEAYVEDRVVVTIDIVRIALWRTEDAVGPPIVLGRPLPEPPPAQPPPGGGVTPRVSVSRVRRSLRANPHRLLAFTQADGYPTALPVRPLRLKRSDVVLAVPLGLPAGGRRAGLTVHRYRPHLIGLAQRVHTGWLEPAADGTASYSPHTARWFAAPPNKAMLLFSNGLAARYLRRRNARCATEPT